MAPLTLWFVLVVSVANVAGSPTAKDEAGSYATEVDERAALAVNPSTRPALFGAEAAVVSVANVAGSPTAKDEAGSYATEVDERAALAVNPSTRPALFGAEAAVEELGDENAAVHQTAAYSALASVKMINKRLAATKFVKKKLAEAKDDGDMAILLIVASAILIFLSRLSLVKTTASCAHTVFV